MGRGGAGNGAASRTGCWVPGDLERSHADYLPAYCRRYFGRRTVFPFRLQQGLCPPSWSSSSLSRHQEDEKFVRRALAGNEYSRRLQNLPLKVIADEIPEQGPLGGIITAMHSSQKKQFFVAACDTPLFGTQDVEKIVLAANKTEAVIAVDEQGHEAYTLALYSRNLLSDMEISLANKERSLKNFLEKCPNIKKVVLEEGSMRNINTPSDLRKIEEQNYAD